MWRRDWFRLLSSYNGNNCFVIEGEWKVGVNVYSSGSLREKKLIWEEISEFRRRHNNRVRCVLGDFIMFKGRRREKVYFL